MGAPSYETSYWFLSKSTFEPKILTVYFLYTEFNSNICVICFHASFTNWHFSVNLWPYYDTSAHEEPSSDASGLFKDHFCVEPSIFLYAFKLFGFSTSVAPCMYFINKFLNFLYWNFSSSLITRLELSLRPVL